jgi:hypothetical protein
VARIYTDDAELYDIPVDWDISDEVEWLLGRLAGRGTLVVETVAAKGAGRLSHPRRPAVCSGTSSCRGDAQQPRTTRSSVVT